MIREDTVLGLVAAKQLGSRVGRTRLLDIEAILEGHRCVTLFGMPIGEVA